MFRRQNFYRVLKKHTAHAKERWGKLDVHGAGSGWSSPHIGMSVLTEEVGKAARCLNKLELASDPEIVLQWQKELGHRCITIASVASRVAEQFAEEGKQDV